MLPQDFKSIEAENPENEIYQSTLDYKFLRKE